MPLAAEDFADPQNYGVFTFCHDLGHLMEENFRVVAKMQEDQNG